MRTLLLQIFSKYKHSKDTKKFFIKHPLLPISINLTKKEEVKTTDIDFSENYEENIKPLAVEKLKNKLGNDIKNTFRKSFEKRGKY